MASESRLTESLAALEESGGDPSGWTIPEWTVEKDLAFSDKHGIAISLLSITAPGAGILPRGEAQAKFCRRANHYAAKVRASHPTRYGFLATIPSLLDPAAAQAEIAYALDELRADGIILYTRYGAGSHYLGHPDFASTWELLDARGAAVLVHPTHPADTALANPSLPQPMIDYPHETTRAACDLVVSGTVRRHPNVSIILSHAGGTLPYLALRPAAMLPYIPGGGNATGNGNGDGDGAAAPEQLPEEITERFMEDARSFYFDTALSAAHLQLRLLSGFARPGRVLFGSDFPYAPEPAIARMNRLLDGYVEDGKEGGEGDGEFMTDVENGAALELFPRLREILGRGGSRV